MCNVQFGNLLYSLLLLHKYVLSDWIKYGKQQYVVDNNILKN